MMEALQNLDGLLCVLLCDLLQPVQITNFELIAIYVLVKHSVRMRGVFAPNEVLVDRLASLALRSL